MGRCHWAQDEHDALMQAYHDTEWGIPIHDDQKHFELLVLEVFQAGLSWRTILHKRENFRKALDGFDPKKIARYTKKEEERLLQDAGIVRNRLKISATIHNAQNFLKIQKEYGSFDAYVWQFVGGVPILGAWQNHSEVPSQTEESKKMSKDLKKHGFAFVGPTICYAYMQSAGLVQDHERNCAFHPQSYQHDK